MNKKFTIKLLLLSCLVLNLRAQTITIPAGNASTISDQKPLGTLYGYERTAALYKSTEIGTTGIITQIGYYLNTLATAGDVPVQVYLKKVSANTLTAGTFANEIANATLVYNGTLSASTMTINSWVTIPLATGYYYDGTSNLEVLIATNATGSGNESFNAKKFNWSNPSAGNVSESWQQVNTPPTANGFVSTTRPNIQLQITPSTTCNSKPIAGVISTPAKRKCTSFSAALMLNGATAGNGISYQWQSSPDSLNWTNVTGATMASYTASITSNIYYRAYVTCTNTNQSDTTPGVSLSIITNIPVTYASLPFFESFENWIGTCFTYDRPGINWLTSPASADNSWRRDDQGVDASWTAPTTYNNSPAYIQGNHSARFHSYYTVSGQSGNMDMYIDLSTPGTKQLAFYYINTSGTDSLQVLLSENGGNTFAKLAVYNTTVGWNKKILNIISTATQGVLRFKAFSDNGGSDIGVDSVAVYTLPACNSKPVAGNIVASAITACSAFASSLSINVNTAIGGYVFQWQSSPDSVNWTNITGATTTSYTANVTANIYYRAYVTCTYTNQSDTTPGVKLAIVTPMAMYASLPFFESFENWIGTCFSYDRPGINWLTNPSSGTNSWRRDDQGTDAAWGNPTISAYTPIFTHGAHSARFHNDYTVNSIYGNMDLYVDLSTPGTKQLAFSHINTTGTDSLLVLLSENGGSTFSRIGYYINSTTWSTKTININSVANHAVIRFRAWEDFGGSDIGLDSISVKVLAACTGMPNAGTISASRKDSCSPYLSLLSINLVSSSGGLTYQWQQSPDSITWTNVPGANSDVYNAQITAPVYYRAYVICASSSMADTTPGIRLNVSPFVLTAATIPYFESFENWISGCNIHERPSINWMADPVTGNSSWRRNDQGADASWLSPNSGVYTPVATQGQYSARLHTTATSTAGMLRLYANLSTPGDKSLEFDYMNEEGSSGGFSISISEDTGRSFRLLSLINTYTYRGWEKKRLVLSSVAPYAILQFAGSELGLNSSDIGIDNLSITPMITCTGKPNAGTVIVPQKWSCDNSFFTILVASASRNNISGLLYKWQISYDSLSWTDVNSGPPQAWDSTYLVLVNTAHGTVYYRVIVTCSGSGLSDTTAGAHLYLIPSVGQYASLPFFESFENWISTCDTNDKPSINWATYPVHGDASWRRDDQGSMAGWTTPATAVYTPVSVHNQHSARFHSSKVNNANGYLDLYVDLSATGSKQIGFNYINTTGNDSLYVMISKDNGLTFTSLAGYGTATSWTKKLIGTNITTATAIIRFSARNNGQIDITDIGIDSLLVIISPACTGKPAAGTISSQQSSNCPPYNAVISVDTPVLLNGITYQWQSSSDSINWSGITGATGVTYTTLVTGRIYYRAYVTCSTGNLSDTTSGLRMKNIVPNAIYATLPFFESFENWLGTCYNSDRPGVNWLISPTIGDSAWRRDDQGADASWQTPLNYSYTPAFKHGAHSARFHSSAISSFNPSSGAMYMYVNLSNAGNKMLSFDYINTSGTDSLIIALSEDGGITYQTLNGFGTTQGWQQKNVAIRSNTMQGILRFRAVSNSSGFTDIGIDSVYVYILPGCNSQPVIGTVTSQLAKCTPYQMSLSLDNPINLSDISYQWQSSPNGISWTNIPGATGVAYTKTITASGYYRAYVVCASNNKSDTTTAIQATTISFTPTYASVPFFESFENWMGTCFNNDRPSSNWVTLPPSGNNSWRRNDQGTDASWTFPTGNIYYPASTNGTYSARLHTSNCNAGDVGSLDLYVNLNVAGTKYIGFDYVNKSLSQLPGSDSLHVQLSTDNGLTFSDLGIFTGNTGWQYKWVSTTSMATQAVVRFKGMVYKPVPYLPGYIADIGLDSVYISVTPPPGATCVAPSGLRIVNVTNTSVDIIWNKVPDAVSYQYVVDRSSADPLTTATYTNDTTAHVSNLTPGTQYYFHIRSVCNSISSSWGKIPFTTTDSVTGITSVFNNTKSLIVVPNPATNNIRIILSDAPSANATVQLTDVVGKILASKNIESNELVWDIHNITPGIYFINYVDNTHKQTVKFIKQ